MGDAPWEVGYADLHAKTFGGPSAEIIALADQMPHGGTVLDMGCGEGRNALFLARKGFTVTAVDILESAINKLSTLADWEGLGIQAEVADMCQYSLSGPYDVIISHGCLHLVERVRWQELVDKLKAHTVPGGINIVVVFTDTLPPPADLADHCLGLFKEGELFSLYLDWNIELQKSYTFEDKHPGSPRHTHSVNKVVARKPPNPALSLTWCCRAGFAVESVSCCPSPPSARRPKRAGTRPPPRGSCR